jgi:hypothetical protein
VATRNGDELKNRIMIYGPKADGTYLVEFRTTDGEALAISVPVGETRVLKHFQARMPYSLFVPDAS